MNKRLLLFIIISFLLIPFISATTHMKLLAVSEQNDTYIGGVADLYLDIKPGNGRIYIDTFPITKVDTQLSIRFAKEISCDYLEIDCSNFDFFYTIRAKSSIVGGPSAGAAITMLTIVNLKNINYDESVSISGTINSGGVIGPVGGLKAKIEAAAKNNIKTVLIPFGEKDYKENNVTIDLIELGKNLSIDVIEVPTINEAVAIFSKYQIFRLNQITIYFLCNH
ncbi:S16 family serine protease [Nanoarchaeota archaeon]